MVKTETTGTIFNIQKFSVHDGPGIRTTVFMKGCPLRCRWCSNAESMNAQPEPGIIRSTCDLCGDCVDVCHHDAITIVRDEIMIDRERCDACGECAEVCSTGAMTIYGRSVTVDEAVKEVMKDKMFYTGSDGGVTVSGGEPLLQSGFVSELFRRCKEEGIGTCLDTCGQAPEASLNEVLPYTDFILYDLKVMDPQKHEEFTGVDNGLIRKNAKTAAHSEADILFRMPLIEGVNSTEENIRDTAEFISSLGKNLSIELLPYHRLGVGKYRTLDREYPGHALTTPADDRITALKNIFESHGVRCSVGG